jgi:peptidoglycan L-alanyl-D-glutamate endopeptidase CwlK
MGREFLLFADGRARIDADLLWPEFTSRLLALLSRCAERGQPYYATCGHRSYAESARLYRAHLAGGPRAAPPGMSGHNFGLAVDVAPDADPAKAGLQPSWDRARFEVLDEEAPRFGLVTGARYGDAPHVEIPGFVRGPELAPLHRMHEATRGTERDKLRAVWRRLDLHPPAAWRPAA